MTTPMGLPVPAVPMGLPVRTLLPGPEALGWIAIAAAVLMHLNRSNVPMKEEALTGPSQQLEVDPTRWTFNPQFDRGNKRAPAPDATVQDLSASIPSIPDALAQLTTHGKA